MEDQRVEIVVESRNEAIFSPSGDGEPITRKACFLKPCIGGPSSFSSSPDASPPSLWPLREPFEPKKWPISVHWKEPLKEWKPWVEKMQTLHGETWRRAGIYEAITGSTSQIIKDGDLVVGLAERWCPATKSFVFPWGEATVTLEDMAIIGGYSVLGCPVYSPLETKEMVAVQELLAKSRIKMVRSSAQRASVASWLREFKDGGSKIEHEAFLACWLSRYVLATTKGANDPISGNSFPIAVLLARGTRVALAPVVLARIYNDLTLFKEKIVALSSSEYNKEGGDGSAVIVRFPFLLVQVWAWERFLELQPEPNVIGRNDALLTKWDKVKPLVKAGSMRLLLDSSKGKFTWRPYAKSVNHGSLPKVCAELGNQLVLFCDSDEDLLAFARCVRVSELVGIGCIEQYLPQRVAMQFGFDQDVPCRVHRCNRSPEIAWKCYDHSEKELRCHLPSSLDGAGVTARYLEWWQSSVGVHQSKDIRFPRQKRTSIATTPGTKKVLWAGSSADRDANVGAKRVSSFTITPKINKETRAASFAKRLNVPVSNTSREMKNGPSTFFKGTTAISNGPKHGRNFISSFKIRPKNSNTSATSREENARVLPTCPGFLKKSSDVAGSWQMHNEFIPSADKREEEAHVLPISTGFLRKNSDDDAGIQNTNIPSPVVKTREGLSFKPERKSLVRILLTSQNLAKRKRLENSKFDARAAARKIARTSALISKYKELKEIYKCSVPPGFQSKDLPGQNLDLPPIADRDASPRKTEPPITTVEIVDLEEAAEGTFGYNGEANAAAVGHSKATTTNEIIDLDNIIDLEEYAGEILGDDGAANSAGEVGRSGARIESEVNADQQFRVCPTHGNASSDDNLDALRPELAARIWSLKADFARLKAKRMQQL